MKSGMGRCMMMEMLPSSGSIRYPWFFSEPNWMHRAFSSINACRKPRVGDRCARCVSPDDTIPEVGKIHFQAYPIIDPPPTPLECPSHGEGLVGATMAFRLHSWHIAVPQGEAAIHLLVKPGGTSSTKKWIVRRAILVDGGKYPFSVVRLEDTIAHINSTYDFDQDAEFEDPGPANTSNRGLRFDSIVISHWDRDHFEGVFGLLLAGIKKSNVVANPNTAGSRYSFRQDVSNVAQKVSDAATEEAKKAERRNIDENGCWYCKYKGSGLAAESLTTVYVAYSVTPLETRVRIGPERSDINPSGGLVMERKAVGATAASYPGLIPLSDFQFGLTRNEGLFKVVSDHSSYLGANLFTGNKIPAASDVTSFLGHSDVSTTEPGFFLVAGDGFVIGKGAAEEKPLGFKGPAGAKENNNSKSLVAMALKKKSSTDFEVWHYTGGDVLWNVEAVVAEWLKLPIQPGTEEASADGLKIKAMKLSQHGSRGASSLDFLAKVEPQFVVLPTESLDTVDYGRPSPEISLFLHLKRLESQKKAISRDPANPTPSASELLQVLPLGRPKWISSNDFSDTSLTRGYFPVFVPGANGNISGSEEFKKAVEELSDTRDPIIHALHNVLTAGGAENIDGSLASLFPIIGSCLEDMFPPITQKVSSWFLDLGSDEQGDVVKVRDRRGIITTWNLGGTRTLDTSTTSDEPVLAADGDDVAWLVPPDSGSSDNPAVFGTDDPFADPEHEEDPALVLDFSSSKPEEEENPTWTGFGNWVGSVDHLNQSTRAIPIDPESGSAVPKPVSVGENGEQTWTWPQLVIGETGITDFSVAAKEDAGDLAAGATLAADDVGEVSATVKLIADGGSDIAFSSAATVSGTAAAEGEDVEGGEGAGGAGAGAAGAAMAALSAVTKPLAATLSRAVAAEVGEAAADWYPGLEEGQIPVLDHKLPVLVLPVNQEGDPKLSLEEIKSLLPPLPGNAPSGGLKIPIRRNGRNALYITADPASNTHLRLEASFSQAIDDGLETIDKVADTVEKVLKFLGVQDVLPEKAFDDFVAYLKNAAKPENLPIDRLACVKSWESSLHRVGTESRQCRLQTTLGNTSTLVGHMPEDIWFTNKASFWLSVSETEQLAYLRFVEANADDFGGALDIGDAEGPVKMLFGDDANDGFALFDELTTLFTPKAGVSTRVVSFLVSKAVGDSAKNAVAGILHLQFQLFGTSWLISIHFPDYKLRAELWEDKPRFSGPGKWLPFTEDFHWYPAPDTETPPRLIDFLSDADPLSAAVEDSNWGGLGSVTIDRAFFEVSKIAGGRYHFEVGGEVSLVEKDGKNPSLGLDSAQFSAVIASNFGGSAGTEFSLSLSAFAELEDYVDDPDQGAQGENENAKVGLDVVFSTADGETAVIVNGGASDLKATHLLHYVEGDFKDLLFPILDQIEIPELALSYEYRKSRGKDDARSRLYITGQLKLSLLLLDLEYEYGTLEALEPNEPAPWRLNAKISIDSAGLIDENSSVGLGEIVSIFNEDLGGLLQQIPAFEEIQLDLNALDPDNPALEFAISKVPDLDEGKATVTWARIQLLIGGLGLSAMLVFLTRKNTGTNDTGRGARSTRKLYLRIRLDQFDVLKKIPIIGQIDVPFDAIDYVLVQHKPTPATPDLAGFTQEEIDAINDLLPEDAIINVKDSQSKVQMKSSSGPDKTKDKAVLRQGHHFMVVREEKVVLDHAFGQNNPPAAPTQTIAGTPGGVSSASAGGNEFAGATARTAAVTATRETALAKSTATTSQNSGSTFGTLKKTVGAFTLESIGLQIKNDYVYVLLDASFSLGVIEMSAQGLGIGLPLKSVMDPKSIDIADVKLEIEGLAVAFNKPPIIIAGAFRQEKNERFEEYIGGLMIQIPPYAVTAVGAYRRDLVDNFKSIFVFGRLEGPLFTLEIATVSGVSVSFGYNYNLRTPKGDDLEHYPLLSKVQGADTEGNPMAILTDKTNPGSFLNWISAEKNMNFFSLGCQISSCHVLFMEAALVFGIGSGKFKVSLVGRGTAIFPPVSPGAGARSPFTFMYCEVGLVATLDVTGGSFMMEAALSSNSYVLNPFCHVRGGFALCYWFPPNKAAGDWVFSLGGYHPAFAVPSHWPVPPRLGMGWEISDVLRIGGEAYFAITPRAVMGGGRLFANFKAGPIYADFEAWANFLINFDPFFFTAEIGVRIRVGAKFSIGFIKINISASVGAELYLQGPPFGGYVDIDFKVIDVRIHFGDLNNRPDPLPTKNFPPPPGPKKGNAMVVISLETGAATELVKKFNVEEADDPQDPDAKTWYVYPGMTFRVESRFAASHLLLTQFPTTGDNVVDTVAEADASVTGNRAVLGKVGTNDIYARPCLVHEKITSLMHVDITPSDHDADDVLDEADVGNAWRKRKVTKSLPSAMWGKYSAREDPTNSGNSVASILNNSDAKDTTIEHTIGFTFRPPPPDLPPAADTFDAFDAATAMSESVFARGSEAAKGDADGSARMGNGGTVIPKEESDGENAVDKRPRFPNSGGEDDGNRFGDLKEYFVDDDKVVWDDISEWKEVLEEWGGANEEGLDTLGSALVEAFGWDRIQAAGPGDAEAGETGAGETGTETGVTGQPIVSPEEKKKQHARSVKVTGKVPKGLLEDMDRYYVSCPWITV
ncbi:uncharacterized protein MKZ38_009345 [Zalerion maritima]|uniref:DUF6603 domain-containing protein n=1 Tax=Zalerion maritima TaxID=339359 RepID=A0AAD5RUK7_9PEZI|nr:uncharacterized protein MKZ38_009345 [Zalerion maritima]